MSEQENEKWLDELIRRSIETSKPVFDVEQWKQKYPDEFKTLVQRSSRASSRQLKILAAVFRHPAAKVAAAAVIIVAVGLLIVRPGPDKQVSAPTAARSPAEMITAISLTMAYRRGGMEAVERQLDRTLDRLGPKPMSLSLSQLLQNSNG